MARPVVNVLIASIGIASCSPEKPAQRAIEPASVEKRPKTDDKMVERVADELRDKALEKIKELSEEEHLAKGAVAGAAHSGEGWASIAWKFAGSAAHIAAVVLTFKEIYDLGVKAWCAFRAPEAEIGASQEALDTCKDAR